MANSNTYSLGIYSILVQSTSMTNQFRLTITASGTIPLPASVGCGIRFSCGGTGVSLYSGVPLTADTVNRQLYGGYLNNSPETQYILTFTFSATTSTATLTITLPANEIARPTSWVCWS